MNENGIQQYTTLEEQLENLKREQAEAERIYRGRMEMGSLAQDPASIQQLAQAILERKMKIDDLEAQIAQTKEESREKDEPQEYEQEYNADNERENNEEKSVTVYEGRNPILRWMQKIINKLEEKIQKSESRSKRDPMDGYREMFEKEMGDVKEMQYDEYQRMASMNDTKVQSPKGKTAHQIFVEKISGNGAYHTYGSNAKNMQQNKTISEPETVKNIESQMKQQAENER